MQAAKRLAAEFRQNGPLLTLTGSIEFAGNWVGDMLRLVGDERSYSNELSLTDRAKLWRRGFLSHAYEFYQLDRNDPKNYLSHYHHRRVASRVNRRASDLLDNKIIFQRYIEGGGIRPSPATCPWVSPRRGRPPTGWS
jgi:hypothetical protein